MTPYRTLFVADLVQDTALSTGGTDVLESTVDAPVCRDGRGRLTLRGESLGGALVATARRLHENLPECVTCDFGVQETTPSRWWPYTTHPVREPRLEIRRSVGIRQDSGARADAVLFDGEIIPRFTRWRFILEVDTFDTEGRDDGAIAERLAAETLLEWRRGRCWLGANVARGLGWAHLENLRAYRLTTDAADEWPDNRQPPDAIIDAADWPAIPADDFVSAFGIAPSSSSDWSYIEIRGRLCAGEAEDGYGVDPIAVGGQEIRTFDADTVGHFVQPESMDAETFREALDPDLVFALTRNVRSGAIEPFLPGSGLRGPLRHVFSRLVRGRAGTAAAVRDPNTERRARKAQDPAELLFGTTEKSAALLVADAHLAEDADWHAACLFHHAKNEFTGGVYASSLHSRAVVIEGEFAWRMVIEYREDPQMTEAIREYLAAVLQLGAIGHLPVGAAKWRSAGWPIWRVDTILWGPAGEDPIAETDATLTEVA